MKYSLQRLQADVAARLGEVGAQSGASLSPEGGGVPWPGDVIALRVRSLLPEIGASLIRDAPSELMSPPSGGWDAPAACGLRMMPCGLYGAEVRLPDGFLRLGSVKMAGWRRGVSRLILPGSPESGRQWSAEPGIAGSPQRPLAYLDSDGGGWLLRLVGSADAGDSLEWLDGWCVPEPDAEGGFCFPEALYPQLAAAVAGRLLE